MSDLPIYILRFRAEVTAPLRLPPAAGAALRGALFAALRRHFCLAHAGHDCGRPPLATACPVCFLLAPVEEGHRRGRDVPRPYVLRGPAGEQRSYEPTQPFEFELLTFGRALSHFPYALLGLQEMGEHGLGVGRGGTFRLREVWSEHPIAGRQERTYRAEERTVRTPTLAVQRSDVLTQACRLAEHGASHRLQIVLCTPTRLVDGGRLVKPETFGFRAFAGRLLERLDALFQRYGAGELDVDISSLLAEAQTIRVMTHRLHWQELFRASARHRRLVPMGGLVGTVTVEGDLRPFLPWLVWGTLTHVGKDAAMGNGRYELYTER
ncbi:MAG: CRISPR system precrRNA processing endoribonuclease RAMP protein Cas6 [Chloroflexi bacterium]|nr:CRISPR system precrRNA processing endoribonuclease RAMP protein Cas6 [Chloroflexota bacterium]